ncbi:MAG TPA: hypothetical protein VMV37_10620 [Gammaproteobacteria bacterium]|nr:hypothetical protein [Gammaproteobacteria bacterium]
MTVLSAATIHDHLDFLIMQPDHEQAIVRDLVFAVLAFNKQARGEPLQISFPLYADVKVTTRGALGPCVRITGPAEKLYVLTLRYEVAAHLRAGRAMTLVRDRVVVEAGRNERFALVSSKGRKQPRSIQRAAPSIEPATPRPLVLSGHSRLLETAGALGATVRDEAAFIERAESEVANDGEIDLLGFSDEKTVPVLK